MPLVLTSCIFVLGPIQSTLHIINHVSLCRSFFKKCFFLKKIKLNFLRYMNTTFISFPPSSLCNTFVTWGSDALLEEADTNKTPQWQAGEIALLVDGQGSWRDSQDNTGCFFCSWLPPRTWKSVPVAEDTTHFGYQAFILLLSNLWVQESHQCFFNKSNF